MKISVIIPAYEPDEKLIKFADSLVEEGFPDIIIVDDGSGERFAPVFDEVKEKPGVTLLAHEVNCGKGMALKTALNHIIKNRPGIDGAVTADSDGQHDIDSIKNCLAAFKENPDTVIIGGRDFSDKTKVPWRSRMGNNISSIVYRFACGIKLKDTQTGLRVIPASCFEDFSKLKGDRYEYETTMLMAIADKGTNYVEVPIETIYIDDNASSHFSTVKDSFRIYRLVLGRLFRFILNSIICWIVDEGLFYLFLSVLLPLISADLSHAARTWLAVIFARILSSILNYTLNRKTVFKTDESVARTVVRYYILAACQLLASAILLNIIAVRILGIDGIGEVLIKCIVDIALFLISYTVQRKWVFKKRRLS